MGYEVLEAQAGFAQAVDVEDEALRPVGFHQSHVRPVVETLNQHGSPCGTVFPIRRPNPENIRLRAKNTVSGLSVPVQ